MEKKFSEKSGNSEMILIQIPLLFWGGTIPDRNEMKKYAFELFKRNLAQQSSQETSW